MNTRNHPVPRRLLLTLVIAMGAAGPGRAADNDGVRAIGGDRELFIDRYLIDSMSGTDLRLNPPVDAGTAVRTWTTDNFA